MRFVGTLFERLGNHGSRVESTFDVPWEEDAIISAFGSQLATAKDGQQLWSAARYEVGANRGRAGILANTGVVLDADCCDRGRLAEVLDHVRKGFGLAGFMYTTWSHLMPNKLHTGSGRVGGPWDCFRLVLPYSREVTPAEHTAIVEGMYGHEVPNDPLTYVQEVLGKLVLLPSGKERAATPRGWDPVSSRPTQGYYAPSDHAEIEVWGGAALDVDAILTRPTTARPSLNQVRPYQEATAVAMGALATFQRALTKYGIAPGWPSPQGWHRSVCPSCKDPSPSLTYRANGDGIDIHDHAQCKRQEVLDALGLRKEDFRAPSQLRMKIEEQLIGQKPPEAAVSAHVAGDLLYRDIVQALQANHPTVIKYPAGTGKSHQSAKAIALQVEAGYRVAYSTQEHAVAHETKLKLPAHIQSRAVHIHSPLVQVGDEPVCQRKDELMERVFDYGLSLQGKVCPRCRFAGDCPALAGARDRTARLRDAAVVFVSHAGIGQVIGVDSDGGVKGQDLQLIVDEMPGTYQEVSVDVDTIRAIATGEPMTAADASSAKLAQAIARAWLLGEEPGELFWGDERAGKSLGNAVQLAVDWGRLSLREHAVPPPGERKLLKGADALIRLCAHEAAGGSILGRETNCDAGVRAMLPDACQQALVARNGVLLSATPMMAALPGFKLSECEVTDGARVRRVMVPREKRGSQALTQSYYDDEQGARVLRPCQPGEGPGIPWPDVDEALERALREADRYECKRVLFVTFKALADALRGDPSRLRGRVEVAHYGALRGKNNWMEGQRAECSVVYCFGTPRQNMLPTIYQLGLVGAAADQAWVAYAAGELAQAEGRLRLPRRTLPCTVFVEGDVAPSSWHPDLVDEFIETAPAERPASAILEGALSYRTVEECRRLGVLEVPGGPYPVLTKALLDAAYPDFGEACDLLSRMTPGRQARFHAEFTWAPFSD